MDLTMRDERKQTRKTLIVSAKDPLTLKFDCSNSSKVLDTETVWSTLSPPIM